MRRTLAVMAVLIISITIYATETPVSKSGEQMTSVNPAPEKSKLSLIKQSTKKADIDEEVDTQALKLGGIHRREDARQYLELKNQVEQSNERDNDKTRNQKEISNVVTQK
ncbi:hypothetical protein FPL18_13170 [Acinetobacter gyllenbergii]|nr:hypothetical protein FPL18_13170 [Acinetobacter gyllenbergii]